MVLTGMIDDLPQRRWFCPTPAWLILALPVVECLLLLSERFQWFTFNHHKGWTVLIAVAAVGIALVLMLLWFVVALVFRRRFQFSLRSLLVLVVVVALPFSWLAVEMKKAREQKAAVDALRDVRRGTWATGYDYQPHYDSHWLRTQGAEPPGTLWLRRLLGQDFFADIVFVQPQGGDTDKLLEQLKGLPRVEVLDLSSSQVSDAGLEPLRGLVRLKSLSLRYTDVTEKGLEHTQITDAGLEHLKGLTQLHTLSLEHTQITDAGLKHLKGLTNLRYLDLLFTPVTGEGVKKLQQALPNCKIER